MGDTGVCLIQAGNLLSSFLSIVVKICSHMDAYDDAILQRVAVTCLCKFMCISATVCEDHLRLLFTVRKRTQDKGVRANIAVAIGDLAFRYPNILEPWTPHM